ncbi:MAG: FMN-binding protein [Eubacterium sp.]|nr:FMN-binding protein [Eubacterium sp.]
MKAFFIKTVNAGLILAMLFGYNAFAQDRTDEYEEEKTAIEEENREIEERNALIEAAAESADAQGTSIADGTYEGTGYGFGGDIVVEVKVEGGEITAVDIISADNEDAEYFDMAKSVVDDIVEAGSADVDTVSGATFSSTGIIDAVKDALDGAQ